jgi:hypothetical protein
MWSEFPSHLIINSFDSCGIMNQYNLHFILLQCLTTKIINSDFIDDFNDAENISRDANISPALINKVKRYDNIEIVLQNIIIF